MKTLFLTLSMILASALLVGCGGEYVEVYAEDRYHDTEPAYHDATYYDTTYYETEQTVSVLVDPFGGPSLEEFHIVDSYGNSSEQTPNTALALDPYTDDGWFEIYWYAQSWDDYWVEYYVSDNPSLDGALYVGSQLCGVGLECEDEGLQFCRYDAEFGLSCDTGEGHIADVGAMIYAIPQTLFVILQVCDLGYESCEYGFYPVMFE